MVQVLLVELVPKDIWYLCSTGCRFVLLLSTVTKRPIRTLVIEFVYIHGLSFNYPCKVQNLLKEEFERQRTQNSPFLEGEGELGEISAPAPSNVQVFEKVLGARRGIYWGLGRKPSLSSALGDVSPHEKEKTRPQFSEMCWIILTNCFEDPRFMERLYQAMDKKESRKGNESDTDEEGK
ncbi:hypothetical protein HanPSC8_Chr10g0427171 [Helianthus annuus]|nr:hypothetical protein HanPSC8_Chr10g0427171 [Helianthus annuus]